MITEVEIQIKNNLITQNLQNNVGVKTASKTENISLGIEKSVIIPTSVDKKDEKETKLNDEIVNLSINTDEKEVKKGFFTKLF